MLSKCLRSAAKKRDIRTYIRTYIRIYIHTNITRKALKFGAIMEKTPNSSAPTLKLVNGPAGRDYSLTNYVSNDCFAVFL
jgi:hypothetical protein